MDTQPLNVVILAHASLLSGGIASKLQEYSKLFNVHNIDSDAPGAIDLLKEAHPSVIIIDAGDKRICEKLPIAKILEWLPEAKVIRLDLCSDRIKVYSSVEVKVSQTSELINLIQTCSITDSPL